MLSQDQSREAGQVEHEVHEVAEDTALLLALLLKDIKAKLPPDLQVQLGDNPDVSIKVGEQEVFRGTSDQPVIDQVEANDLNYVQLAISQPQGFKHSEFDRDVLITVKGQPVFELKGGEVVLNQIGPEHSNTINLALDGVPPNELDPNANKSQAPAVDNSLGGVPPTILDPKATRIQEPVVEHGVEQIEFTPPLKGHQAPTLHEELQDVEFIQVPPSVDWKPPEQEQETPDLSDEQIYQDARAIVDSRGTHSPDWTEKSFIGQHFTVTRYLDQVTVEVPKDSNPVEREVVLQGDGKSFSISKLTPEIAQKVHGAAEIVADRESAPEKDGQDLDLERD